MAFDRFLIAPINSGLQTDLRAWLIPDDAFARMNNAYVFRGRVRKRFGSSYTGIGWDSELTQPLFSRLRIDLGTDESGTVPTGSVTKIGQLFSAGDQVFTAWQTSGDLLATAGPGSGTYNTTNGDYSFSGIPGGTHIYFYPAEPVMGLGNIESSVVNDNPSIAFDTRWAYLYNGSWGYSSGSGPWHGDDTNFFWTSNWIGSTPDDDTVYVSNFFVVNQNGSGSATDDFIWRYDVSTATWTQMIGSGDGSSTNGIYFDPNGGDPHTGPYVVTARIIVPFHNHLVLLNTIENDGSGNITTPTYGVNTHYPFRARYSAYGTVLDVNSWYELNASDNAGAGPLSVSAGASFIDASTEEEIIGAEFIKDRLIVYFTNSTWELVWTGNGIVPFQWQKINTELGSDATFSLVPFDRDVLAIGTVGVHACNGSNVQRIDEKIPDDIFKLNKKPENILRVVGIRDYYTEMVYWTFPNTTAQQYPNKVLVYNYRNNTWAFNDDTITFFGYFEQGTDKTWAQSLQTWEEADFTWTSGIISANFRQVIAGNQQGFVYIVNPDISWNEEVFQITNMVQSGKLITVTIIDHTLIAGDYISIGNLQFAGVTITDINGNNPSIFQVNTLVDADTITIGNINYPLTLTGDYSGGATMGRVSLIDILSKQWNPYIGKGRNFYLARIDFCVKRTGEETEGVDGNTIYDGGEITVDYYPSGSQLSMLEQGGNYTDGTNSIMGNGVLETFPYNPAIYPFEKNQERLWHPIYFETDGQTIQIRLYFTNSQITDPVIAYADFELEGMVLHCQPTSYRLQ